MTIHLISFASLLHKQVSLRSSHEAILSELEKYYTVNGVQVKTPTKGVFVKKTGFENGAVKTEKVVVFQTVVK